jgi:hypothetical protein
MSSHEGSNERIRNMRGRPTEQPAMVPEKRVQKCIQVPGKPELGWQSTWHYDINKSTTGPWRVDHTPPKDFKPEKVKVIKNQSYGGVPVVMVFKTSNRSNAKTKMKIWNNTNIDYIMTADKLPGIPDNAEILELGVGESFIDKWQSKYNL